jgi:septal ring-binding cell division protein DamX
LEKDRSKLLETDSPALRTIRSLENRLDKAMVKQNEAASIGKTYEGIVERLREERLTFDAQLKAVEEAVRGKTVDLDQLNSMSNEAQLAKEAAMSELRAAHATVEREREHRTKELGERRAHVARAEALAEEEASGGDPATRAAVATYDEAFRRVQEEAGVVSLQEFVDRFLGQPSMRADLKAMESDTALRIENLNHKMEGLKVGSTPND